MILVLALAGGLWGLGWATRAPHRQRWSMIAVLWLVVMALNLALPQGHVLRQVTGGDARVWLILGGVFGLILGYRRLLKKLKAPSAVADAQAESVAFRAAELDRYARHIMLREIGGPGQKRLKDARVLVIGAGGLGSPALLYLAAAGVGTLGVIDDDVVETSNLQRQIIHTDQRIGMPKVQSAALAVKALNPFITLRPYNRRLTPEMAATLIADYDLVLDGSDNFDTRDLVNRACVTMAKPLISGAITQWEGQLSLFDPARGSPCYACVFPNRPAPGLVPTCAEAGVAAPLPGVIGAMMAMEAVKHITGAGQTLAGRLMIHDALFFETRMIGIKPNPTCEVCGNAHARQDKLLA